MYKKELGLNRAYIELDTELFNYECFSENAEVTIQQKRLSTYHMFAG